MCDEIEMTTARTNYPLFEPKGDSTNISFTCYNESAYQSNARNIESAYQSNAPNYLGGGNSNQVANASIKSINKPFNTKGMATWLGFFLNFKAQIGVGV